MEPVDIRQILELVEESLDDPDHAAGDLASRAYLSRFYFDRLVTAALGEPPGAFRRRLLLERAAHRLATDTEPVIAVALDAGYASPDAFTRAFTRSFGITPSEYRRTPPARHEIATANGIHFHPPGGLRLPATRRSSAMDVLTSMYDHHVQLTGAIVDRLADVPDEVLDRPITISVESIDSEPTLRSVTERLVRQLEMWVVAVDGGESIPSGPDDPAALRSRLDEAAPRFRAAVVAPIEAGEADRTFVDATCTPAHTFSLGGVLAHVLTFSAVRRTLAVGALESAGIGEFGSGDPMAYVGGAGEDASRITRRFD
jgi:AraC family transcriptional regulator